MPVALTLAEALAKEEAHIVALALREGEAEREAEALVLAQCVVLGEKNSVEKCLGVRVGLRLRNEQALGLREKVGELVLLVEGHPLRECVGVGGGVG